MLELIEHDLTTWRAIANAHARMVNTAKLDNEIAYLHHMRKLEKASAICMALSDYLYLLKQENINK